MEAVERYNQKMPIFDKQFNSDKGWTFLFTMKQNEYFVFPDKATGFMPEEIDMMDKRNYSRISQHLYRVQAFSTKDYFFRHHLETNVENISELKGYTWKRIRNLSNLEGVVKVRVNHIGEIVKIGEE